jgi:hypothetical protein
VAPPGDPQAAGPLSTLEDGEVVSETRPAAGLRLCVEREDRGREEVADLGLHRELETAREKVRMA